MTPSPAATSSEEIKCVVWDLDETVWDGSLAEGDEVVFRPAMIELVRRLDAKGVINSICSKNEPDEAQRMLEAAGIWRYFVFPSISFDPKGPGVRDVVDAMRLRAADVLFVDDSPSNRHEVAYFCPDITVLDPNGSGFMTVMESILIRSHGQSRLERYRALERKHQARKSFDDNIDFLNSSGITVGILRNPSDLAFRDRVVELANRSNQLNHTRSRFKAGEFDEYVGGDRSIYIHHGVVLAYDKYGDYGLVGFYAFDERAGHRELEHFFFSCRVMDMGIEHAVYNHLQRRFEVKPLPSLTDFPRRSINLSVVEGLDERMRRHADAEMGLPRDYAVSIIAGCSAGVFGHYLGSELEPARFDAITLAENPEVQGVPAIIYAVYQDYVDLYWKTSGGFSPKRFREALDGFLDRHATQQVFLVLASENRWPAAGRALAPRERLRAWRLAFERWRAGGGRHRMRQCNALVHEAAEGRGNVFTIDSGNFIYDATEQIDYRHFERVVIRRISQRITTLARGRG